MTLGLLDAATVTRWDVDVNPFISIRTWLTVSFSSLSPALLQLGAMKLNLSMKGILPFYFAAS
jgi:hypothetical protein